MKRSICKGQADLQRQSRRDKKKYLLSHAFEARYHQSVDCCCALGPPMFQSQLRTSEVENKAKCVSVYVLYIVIH